jgi:hypothetical protein
MPVGEGVDQPAEDETSCRGENFGKILPTSKNILRSLCELSLESGDIEWPEEQEKFGTKNGVAVQQDVQSQEVESLGAITQTAQSLSPQLLEAARQAEDLPGAWK